MNSIFIKISENSIEYKDIDILTFSKMSDFERHVKELLDTGIFRMTKALEKDLLIRHDKN